MISRLLYSQLPRTSLLRSSRCFHSSSQVLFSRKIETEYVAWDEAGHKLLENPVYNKGTAFTEDERDELGLRGLLPSHVDTLDEQMKRAYASYLHKPTDLERHIYLRQIQDTNEVLFYALVTRYIREFLPILYTPTVGLACLKFSNIYRKSRGLFLSYPDRHKMRDIFKNLLGRGWSGSPVDVDTKLDVRVIVVTDGGRVLGLGDLGASSMGISIGKCCLYSAIGGIPGAQTLPITLDVGTDNETLLRDPAYIGWRHERLTGEPYFEFVDQFVNCVKEFLPDALLQFEDFNINSAQPLLDRYKNELCTFNDDIQGTAAVTLGTLLAACKQIGRKISEQKVVIVGSGSAGCGIGSMIKKAMMDEGLSEEEARANFFMMDRPGLLHDGLTDLRDFQKSLVQDKSALEGWSGGDGTSYSLLDVMHNAKPDILLGVSGVPGLFTEDAIRAMAAGCPRRPIISPLSNPTERVEGRPKDIMEWTNNTAIVATGTAFEPTEVVTHASKYTRTVKTHVHTQCNNSYVFPAIGLAAKVVKANLITDNMLMASSKALADVTPATSADSDEPLLPPLEEVIETSKIVAHAVGMQAFEDNVARIDKLSSEQLTRAIEKEFWYPQYKHVRIDSAMWTKKKSIPFEP